MKIIAVDPGKVSGLVIVSAPIDGVMNVEHWAELGRYPLLELVDTEMSDGTVSHLVVERFVIRPGRPKTMQTDHPEIIGVLDWLAHLYRVPVTKQSVSDALAFGTAEKLAPYRRHAPHVGRGGAGHAVVALQHSLLWLTTVGYSDASVIHH